MYIAPRPLRPVVISSSCPSGTEATSQLTEWSRIKVSSDGLGGNGTYTFYRFVPLVTPVFPAPFMTAVPAIPAARYELASTHAPVWSYLNARTVQEHVVRGRGDILASVARRRSSNQCLDVPIVSSSGTKAWDEPRTLRENRVILDACFGFPKRRLLPQLRRQVASCGSRDAINSHATVDLQIPAEINKIFSCT